MTLQDLVSRGVLVPRTVREKNTKPVVVVCDSETVIEGLCDKRVSRRVIANVAGVLVGTPESDLQSEIGVDPDKVLYEPLQIAFSNGHRYILLVVNPDAVWGIMSEMTNVELIDHMMQVAREIRERMPHFELDCVVVKGTNYGEVYTVNPEAWTRFYATYETRVLGRQDDGLELVPATV
ncbi:hypothetical protein HZA85_03425 [Candidatus Uhrbacteria bacterium]|nr:hypothetical protein [Candidatus Uhrbacteria bacterium]